MATSDGSDQKGPMDASKYISQVTERANLGWGRGDERYDMAKKAYESNKALADKITGKAFDTGDLANRYSQEDRDFWTGTYRPAMQQQMDYARQYTTPERMAQNRQAAIGQGALAMRKEREGLEQGLMSHNIDPSSGRYAGLEAGLAAKEAMIKASAGTGADRYTEETGQKYLDNAIKQGAGLNAQAQGWTKTGQESLNQALNAPLAVEASGTQSMGTGLQHTAQGNDMIKEWLRADIAQTDAGLRGQEIQLKRDEAGSKDSSGIGAAVGGAGGILGGVMQQSGGMGSIFGGGAGGAGGGAGTIMNAGSGAGGSFGSVMQGGIMSERGGAVPRLANGGTVPMAHAFMGGGMSGIMEGGGGMGGGMGFSGPDVQPMSLWGGQDFDPYDPGAQLWGNLGEVDNPEREDTEAEGIGRQVGGTAGGMIGSIWGPIGQMAGREIGQKVGGAGGAIAEGNWGDAAQNLAEGTPFDMFFSAKGGRIPRYARGGAIFDTENDAARITGDDAWGNPSYLPGPEMMGDDVGFTEREVPDQMREQEEFVPFNLNPQRPHIKPMYPMPQDMSPKSFAEGGDVTPGVGGQQGNMVPGDASPSNGAETDDVHAMVSVDEFVIPKDVAKWVGEKFLQNLIDKSRRDMQGATAKPEMAQIPQAIALSPPSFKSEGASA